MFSGVEYVREICQQRNIPISVLEKDCGFANGYLNPKKLKKIPYDRALIIAEYLGISVDVLLTGKEKAPVLTQKDERDIARQVNKIMEQLDQGGDLMFDGNPMSAAARDSIRAAINIGLETAKVLNKETYTPKKYRKKG